MAIFGATARRRIMEKMQKMQKEPRCNHTMLRLKKKCEHRFFVKY